MLSCCWLLLFGLLAVGVLMMLRPSRHDDPESRDYFW